MSRNLLIKLNSTKMEIIKIKNKLSLENIQQIVKILKKGGIIIYPTDTAYGLGADIASPIGIKKILKLKQRNISVTLPLIAGSLDIVKKCVKLNIQSKKIIAKYWPGPLTLILEARATLEKNSAARYFISKNKKIAIRIPDNNIAQIISKNLNRPIISTSANIHGLPVCYSIKQFLKQTVDQKIKPDLILDAGKLPKTKPSTIVDVTKKPFTILRQGPIKI